MYVCGPTVYDVPHLGHGRFSLVFDVVRRYLEWRGFEVRYVSNITDIDDNIIERANRDGRDWRDVVEQYEAVWWEAMDALNVKRPTESPHATAYVDQMIDLIGRLVAAGHAYETSDGVYFDPAVVSDYGLLARQPLESLRAGARVEANDEKRSPVDFALWKKAKPGEPAWPSPWGDGRPGWHTECVVVALDLLGEGFDIHGGGQDLAFHENERAQAAAEGRAFARIWMHNGWVVDAGGEKMSKSLDNFTSLSDLLERTDGRAYRLLVLRAHYRSPIEVTPRTVSDAEKALERIDALARRFPDPVPDRDSRAVDRFRELMDDDLQSPQAMSVVFELVTRANALADGGDAGGAAVAAATAFELLAAVGIDPRREAAELDAVTAELVRRRDEARAQRDFSEADRLRDELQAMGWTVEDGAGGTTVRR
jgi:cysteinyl-tRNA synthetase